jgi:hypothetical protein
MHQQAVHNYSHATNGGVLKFAHFQYLSPFIQFDLVCVICIMKINLQICIRKAKTTKKVGK